MTRVVLFKGNSAISRLIRWFSWGEYSHAAIMIGDTVYDSYEGSGVRKYSFDNMDYPNGTKVHIYDIKYHVSAPLVKDFLEKNLGKKYDYKGIIGFLTASKLHSDKEWFCSELVTESLKVGGCILLNAPSHKVTPTMLSYSTRLRFNKEVIIKK